MSIFTFNKEQAAKNNTFTVLPIGEYECIITKAEKTQAKSSGADMIKLTLTVRADANEQGGNRKLFDNMVFSEKALFKVEQLLLALGFEDKAYDTYDEMVRDLLYKYVRVKIKHEADNQDPTIIRERVHYYKPSENPGEPISADPAADPFVAAGGPELSDEDLPF